MWVLGKGRYTDKRKGMCRRDRNSSNGLEAAITQISLRLETEANLQRNGQRNCGF